MTQTAARRGVLVVGAGISGIACARALQQGRVPVRIVDRGRVPGGRMASRRLAGRVVDTGASYVTASDDDFGRVVEGWLRAGLARPWTDTFASLDSRTGERCHKRGPMRYAAPAGLRSLVEALADGLDVSQEVVIDHVGAGPTANGDAYDAVVLAMPGPQAERLLDPELATEHAVLANHAWEPVLTISAGYPDLTGVGDGTFVDGMFVNGHDVLAWVAHDGRRRGDNAPVLVAHTTPEFAAGNLDDPVAAVPEVLAALTKTLGTGEARWHHAQRWAYARPAAARDEPFHLGAALVGMCGDGWGRAKVETAWRSGADLGRELTARVG